ncbi:MAG TPA: RNA methyltransferase [Solirubrobacteraceae bacterium]|nr:RNA methyltransferase [Solirubrobacteraceae bacterium]
MPRSPDDRPATPPGESTPPGGSGGRPAQTSSSGDREQLSPAALRRIFREARRDPGLAVLEGLHPLKHAIRFGAEIVCVAITERERLQALAGALAPDVLARIERDAQAVSRDAFAALAPQPPATGVISLARRTPGSAETLLAAEAAAPVVLLENPRDLGNLGACVRVAAAADIAGVLSTGGHDPWDPAALRGSAGLHFALPVCHLGEDALARLGGSPAQHDHERPLIAVDPDGEQLHPTQLPARAILAFGGERRGLSAELLANADARVSLPMRAGVSSLNLATSVAALLYAWRLS